jgi:putative ABC transport system substrate-binding protein
MMKQLMITLALLIGLAGCSEQKSKKEQIAILTPVSHPSLVQIEEAFMAAMEKSAPERYEFTVYNGQGNKSLIRSEIEEIARVKPSLILTLGASSTQMAVEYLAKKHIDIPLVFTAVNDPVALKIVSSENSSGNMATGVKELLRFDEQLEVLRRYLPDAKNILLVYNPFEPGLQRDREEIAKLLQQKHMQLIPVEVFQSNEILAKTAPFMSVADAVLVIKDNTVISALDALVKLCNRYKKPLMASDLDSPDKGAAIGYGVEERSFGEEAAIKAQMILLGHKKPKDIPITGPSQFSVKINKEAALQQGLQNL